MQGADDVGFVEIDRKELDDQREDILRAFLRTRALVSFVVRLNPEPIRTPARSVANLEFHYTGDHVNEVGRSVVRALEDRGIGALNPSMGFPMEMDTFPGKIWVVSHKPVALWTKSPTSSNALFRFAKGNKVGFIDASGRVVIPPSFEADANRTGDFAEGLVAVQTDGGWAYVDANGRTVLEPQFIAPSKFVEGVAATLVKTETRFAYG